MYRAKEEGVPLKVKLPEHLAPVSAGGFDLSMPIKKRPVFADVAGPGAAEALQLMESTLPVKKHVPSYVLEDAAKATQPGMAR
jgi:hypothetical protein